MEDIQAQKNNQAAAGYGNVGEIQSLATQTDDQLIWSFLLSQDSFLSLIISKSTFSALYELDPASGTAQKLNVEGSLYLLERSVPPVFKMLILNRKSREDWADQITSST